jgi:hypothetical protein
MATDKLVSAIKINQMVVGSRFTLVPPNRAWGK